MADPSNPPHWAAGLVSAGVVGLAPPDAAGLDWYDGMPPGNVEEFTAAANGEGLYGRLWSGSPPRLPPRLSGAESRSLTTTTCPRTIAERSAPDAGYLDRMRETYIDGVDGWIDDGIAFTHPWGFDPTEVAVPVSVWCGRQDVLGPQTHPEHLLAVIPTA